MPNKIRMERRWASADETEVPLVSAQPGATLPRPSAPPPAVRATSTPHKATLLRRLNYPDIENFTDDLTNGFHITGALRPGPGWKNCTDYREDGSRAHRRGQAQQGCAWVWVGGAVGKGHGKDPAMNGMLAAFWALAPRQGVRASWWTFGGYRPRPTWPTRSPVTTLLVPGFRDHTPWPSQSTTSATLWTKRVSCSTVC